MKFESLFQESRFPKERILSIAFFSKFSSVRDKIYCYANFYCYGNFSISPAMEESQFVKEIFVYFVGFLILP